MRQAKRTTKHGAKMENKWRVSSSPVGGSPGAFHRRMRGFCVKLILCIILAVLSLSARFGGFYSAETIVSIWDGLQINEFAQIENFKKIYKIV